jgi:hypothetical protein
MLLPHARGPLSTAVVRALRLGGELGPDIGSLRLADGPLGEDAQLTLWTLYELHYRGFEDVAADREWDPGLLCLRARIEHDFERALRDETADAVAGMSSATEGSADFATALLDLIEAAPSGPSAAAHLHREAGVEQVLEMMKQRSISQLKESDPTAWVLPRIDGAAKVALAELLYDEYGAGRASRLHATLFADALTGCGLDSRYGAYIDEATTETLAANNATSLFGLHRRLRGAALGHLAAFEATSSVPSRKIAAGIERVGLPAVVSAYFHEHVEADAVHEQVATRDICGTLVAGEPDLRGDVLFGVATCLHLEAVAGQALLDRMRLQQPVAEPA